MTPDQFEFSRFIEDGGKGRRQLLEAIRGLTGSQLEAVNIDVHTLSETVLLEPRLIGWHFGPMQAMVSILQVIFPEVAELQKDGFTVISDDEGAITLSGYGTILTGRPATAFLLKLDEKKTVRLRTRGEEIEFELIRCKYIPETGIEIIQWIDPVLKGFFSQHVTEHESICMRGVGEEVPPSLYRALDLIKTHLPEFFAVLTRSLRAMLLFEHPSLNSFAALQMHGMIFLNINRPMTSLFFIDGLVHQGGHVIFSEATLERHLYFKVPPDTKLAIVTGRNDGRSVYETLHGLYTEFALLDVFSGIAVADLAPQEKLELEGRFNFILRRFGADLKLMGQYIDAIFSPLGADLMHYFQHQYSCFEALQRTDLFDLTGQTDEFDFEQFAKLNDDSFDKCNRSTRTENQERA